MGKKFKLLVLVVFLGIAGYFLLSYHFVYLGSSIKLLNKARLTSDYTFVFASKKSAESILRIDTPMLKKKQSNSNLIFICCLKKLWRKNLILTPSIIKPNLKHQLCFPIV